MCGERGEEGGWVFDGTGAGSTAQCRTNKESEKFSIRKSQVTGLFRLFLLLLDRSGEANDPNISDVISLQ